MQSKSGPVYTLVNEENKTGGALGLCFNKNQLDLLACAYPGGVIKIYQLNKTLCNPLKNELVFFDGLTSDAA